VLKNSADFINDQFLFVSYLARIEALQIDTGNCAGTPCAPSNSRAGA
jgi:hypothetical protein